MDWFIFPKRWENKIASKLVPINGALNLIWFYAYVFCLLCYFLITMIMCFLKPDIFNLTITSVSIYFLILMYIPNSFRQKSLRLILYWAFLAFIFDISWVIIMLSTWYTNANKDPEGDSEAGTKSLDVTLTIISLIC